MNRNLKLEALKKLMESQDPRTDLVEKLKSLTKPKNSEEVLLEVKKETPYLGGIAMVESSGGKNLEHPTLQSGMHKGQKAGGMFGMMPLTAKETLKLNPELARHYPELTQDLAPEAFTDRFNTDPEADTDFAKALYERNKAKVGSDEGATYAQYNGLGGALKARSRGDDFNASPYVQKVKDAMSNRQPNGELASIDLETLLKGLK